MLSATPLSLEHGQSLPPAQHSRARRSSSTSSEFGDRIEPNRHLNQAMRALRRTPPDVEAALTSSSGSADLRQGHLFVGNPFYEGLSRELADRRPRPTRQRFSPAAEISDLNTIGHVFTRTRKREVQDQFPTRRAIVVKVG